MKAPGREVYEQERDAAGQTPQEFLRHAGEERFEAALFTDPWHVWPVLVALTMAWIVNVMTGWHVTGVVAMLETAAFAGLAAQQVEPLGSRRRYLMNYLVWTMLACISARGSTSALAWLAGGFVLTWIVVMVVGKSATNVVQIWQRVACVGWIISLSWASSTSVPAALALTIAGLMIFLVIRMALRRQRQFVAVVLLWALLHALALRNGEGALALHVALIVPGFFCLVIACWRFGEASLVRWPRSIYRSSPLCLVPRLDQSRDHPLKIDVL